MKSINISRRGNKKLTAMLSLTLAIMLAGGVLISQIGATVAAPPAIFNHPYTEPFPPAAAVVFGPDLVAWSRYKDHPGYDTAYTQARSQAYAGIASPNHIHTGGSALTFFGYNNAANLDYILSEEYGQFSGVSYELRPAELNFSALSQSGFLFNGSVTDVGGDLFYSGYMIALEANGTGTSADLRLYYVTAAPLSDTAAAFENPVYRTPISAYAMGITPGAGQPVFVQVEANPATQQFQVYINGELRTQDLPPIGTGKSFGFFAASAARATTNLTKVTYSNLRVQAPWVSKTATATVYFKLAGTSTDLAASQSETGYAAGGYGGQNGQNHYIVPPAIPGYTWVNDPTVALDYIPYFARNEYNETTLYYVKDTAKSTKDAWTWVNGVRTKDRGTAANPVLVAKNDIIDYEIYAAGDGSNSYVGTLQSAPSSTDYISMATHGKPNPWSVVNSSVGGNSSTDIVIGTHDVASNGATTVDSNVSMTVGFTSGNSNQTPSSDRVLVGFTSLSPAPNGRQFRNASGGNPPAGIGGEQLPYAVPCTGHLAKPVTNLAANDAAVAACPACNGSNGTKDRYIKLTYNNLNNDSAYAVRLFLCQWTYSNHDDYWFVVEGLDALENPVLDPITGQPGLRIYRPNGLIAGNNPGGHGFDGRYTSELLPCAADGYKDPYTNDPTIFPENGSISITIRRIHNANHDYNFAVGAGTLTPRKLNPVMRVVDVLPLGVQYVPGSAAYEDNLTITTLPDGRQQLVWSFSRMPPEGYTIPFQAKVVADGTFINHADVEYIDKAASLPNERTNNTYHWTGNATVIEHFLDANNLTAPPLRLDNIVRMYLGASYTTSQSSLNTILMPNGDTYRYVGYRLPGGSGAVIPGQPPTITGVTGTRDIDLCFVKNPKIIVEFRYIEDETELKDPVAFPVNYGDPFYLPDSARSQILFPDPGGDVYTYCAYAKTDTLSTVINGIPDKPIYTGVTQDQTIIVYFTKKPAVTVRYVEKGNTANVLKNNDYFPVEPGEDFEITSGMMSVIYDPVTKKYYRYEGYSYPGEPVGTCHTGPPPDFEDIKSNKEIILQFKEATTASILEQFRDLDNRNTIYMRTDNPVTITFGADYIRGGTPPASYTIGSRTYYYAGYDLNGGDGVVYSTEAATPARPFVNIIEDGKIITYLYASYEVTEEFRRLSNTGTILSADRQIYVGYNGTYNRGAQPPATVTSGGRVYGYVGYSIDGDDYIESAVAATPASPITGITADGRKITYLYEAYWVTEEFRLWTNHSGKLVEDNDVSVPYGGDYERGGTPPGTLVYDEDGKTYHYVGYLINGEEPVLGEAPPKPFEDVRAEGKVITYLYGIPASVTERFRLWDDYDAIVDGDNIAPIPFGEDYERGEMPPEEITTISGQTYIYKGYDLHDGNGPVLSDAPDKPFTHVTGDERVITYLYELQVPQAQALLLHIRQIVVDPASGLTLPVMGYYILKNEGSVLPLTSDSVSPGYLFTDYFLLPGDEPLYLLTDLVPQYYEFLGHFQNDGDEKAAGHDTPTIWPSPANGSIELNYGDTDEIWVTLYITPNGKPGNQQTAVATNKFGTVYEGEPPITPTYLSSITAIEHSDQLCHANIVLCMDMSSSMKTGGMVEAAIASLKDLVTKLYSNLPVDITVDFIIYNYMPHEVMRVSDATHTSLLSWLDGMTADDAQQGTNLHGALVKANEKNVELATLHPNRKNYVIFITDGGVSNSNPVHQHIDPSNTCPWNDCNNPDHEGPKYSPFNYTPNTSNTFQQGIYDAADLIKQTAKLYTIFWPDPSDSHGIPADCGPRVIKLSSNTPGDTSYFFEVPKNNNAQLAAELTNMLLSMTHPVEKSVTMAASIAAIDLLHPLDPTKPLIITVDGGTPVSHSFGAFPSNLAYDEPNKRLTFDVTGYPSTAKIALEYWIAKKP